MLFHMVNQCKIFRSFIMVIITNVIIVSKLLLWLHVIVVIMLCCASHGHVDCETCQTEFWRCDVYVGAAKFVIFRDLNEEGLIFQAAGGKGLDVVFSSSFYVFVTTIIHKLAYCSKTFAYAFMATLNDFQP